LREKFSNFGKTKKCFFCVAGFVGFYGLRLMMVATDGEGMLLFYLLLLLLLLGKFNFPFKAFAEETLPVFKER